ncbi:MAG: 16S rRNA (guanine(527)-N(7))-methyltransferase RsmG [Burkholderiaceae bacterium]|nr:16S rRNA (guanine(527)-N(7))-methyltransferase RsmG [Burkholderiaceae bacterium]
MQDESDRRARLCAAAQALDVPLDAMALDRLMAYLGLLQRWNRVYNLTALRDPDEMLSHHLVDSLAAVAPIRRMCGSLAGRDAGDRLRILDVGSGGGLPGVVLAVVERDWQVCCVDTVAKKVGFIRQVAAELQLPNLRGLHARVEALGDSATHFDLVVSRAFASLADFTTLSRPTLAERGIWLAMKGRLPEAEIAALPAEVQVFHVEPLQVPGLDAQRCLVWLRPTPDKPQRSASG